MSLPELVIEYRDPETLRRNPKNAKDHPPEQIEALAKAFQQFGMNSPIALKDDGEEIGAGHARLDAALLLLSRGEKIARSPDGRSIPTMIVPGLSEAEWRAYVIADNRLAELGTWNIATLRLELGELQGLGFDIGLTGFTLASLDSLGAGLPSGGKGGAGASGAGALAERFGVVPFSVLNAREGWWQARKAAWLALGIKSEVGRGENLLKMSDTVLEPDPEKRAKARAQSANLKDGLTHNIGMHPYDGTEGGSASGAGTSIFDPVLCELAYRWWSPPSGMVLDPFAGGSVRGVVAAKLGRHYHGIDLRPEQVEANQLQAQEILGPGDGLAQWSCGDSTAMDDLLAPGEKADFIFSCPPYADLERYSDDPRDLSTLDYPEFVRAYAEIIRRAAARLKKDRFACFVVGEVRGPSGNYRGFVPDTIRAFEAAGLALYNEAILVTAAGSLPMRAGKGFEVTRKLGKTHQNCLVFLKGDARKATKAVGPVEFGSFDPGDVEPGQETKYGEKVLSLGGEV